jgi:tRNA(Ile)-lysidine synthase
MAPDLRDRIFSSLDARLDAACAAPVAVALSGGGDSVALLALTAAWARTRGRPVLALTVDHGLQADSGRWTQFAQSTAQGLAAGWRGLAWTGPKPSTGLPAAARTVRHALIADAAREAGAAVVLFAQTADDVREGDAMRADGGSTLGRLREWAPSPAWPQGRDVFLLRPLLGVTRTELRAFLRAEGLDWIEDPANDDPRYARTRARRRLAAGGEGHAAIPTPGPPTEPATRRAAVAARTDAAGVITVDRGLPLTLAFLSAACLCASGGCRPPRGDRLARLQARLSAGENFVTALAGARIEADVAEVRFLRDAGETARGGLAPMTLSPGRASIWDGRFELTASAAFQVRPLKGLAARLDRREKAAISSFTAAARPTLPVLIQDPDLRPVLATAAARVRCLVGPRLAAACGLAAHEGEIVSMTRGVGVTASLC